LSSPSVAVTRAFTRDQRGALGLVAGGLVGLGLQEGTAGALWPDVIDAFDVSNGQFGVASGIGLTVAFPLLMFGGLITTWIDKRLLAAIAAGFMGLAAIGFTSGEGLLLLSAIFVLRGIGSCLIDLTVNAMAMEVEAESGRHLMSPLHSGFSGGAMLGAAVAWVVFALGGGHRIVLLLLALMLALYIAIAVRERIVRPDPRPRAHGAARPEFAFHLLRRTDVRVLAVICSISFCGELLIAQWIGIYLRDEQGNSASIGVRAVIALGGAMFIGRLVNVPVTNRLGPQRSLFVQGAVMAVGGVLIVASNSASLTILGCGVAGLGLAGMAPTALSLAGVAVPSDPGGASGACLMGGYLGVALLPFVAGGVATIASVRVVLTVITLFGIAVVITSLSLNRMMNQDETDAATPAPS